MGQDASSAKKPPVKPSTAIKSRSAPSSSATKKSAPPAASSKKKAPAVSQSKVKSSPSVPNPTKQPVVATKTATAVSHLTGGKTPPVIDVDKLPGVKRADGSVFDGVWNPDTEFPLEGKMTYPTGEILTGVWESNCFHHGTLKTPDGITRQGIFQLRQGANRYPSDRPQDLLLQKGQAHAPAYFHDGEFDALGNLKKGIRVGNNDHIRLEGEFGVSSAGVVRLVKGKQTLASGNIFEGTMDVETGRWLEGALINSATGSKSSGKWSYAGKFPQVVKGTVEWKDGKFSGRRDPITGEWLQGRHESMKMHCSGTWMRSPTTGKSTLIVGTKFFLQSNQCEEGVFDDETSQLRYGRRILKNGNQYEGRFIHNATGYPLVSGIIYDAAKKALRRVQCPELVAGLDTVSWFVPYVQWVLRLPNTAASKNVGSPPSSAISSERKISQGSSSLDKKKEGETVKAFETPTRQKESETSSAKQETQKKSTNQTNSAMSSSPKVEEVASFEDIVLSPQESYLLEKAYLSSEFRVTLTLQGAKETVDLTSFRTKSEKLLKRKLLSVAEAMEDVPSMNSKTTPSSKNEEQLLGGASPQSSYPSPQRFLHRNGISTGFLHYRWIISSTGESLLNRNNIELEVALYKGEAECTINLGDELASKILSETEKDQFSEDYSPVTIMMSATQDLPKDLQPASQSEVNERKYESESMKIQEENGEAAVGEKMEQENDAQEEPPRKSSMMETFSSCAEDPSLLTTMARVQFRSFPREMEFLRSDGTKSGLKFFIRREPISVADWLHSLSHVSVFLQLNDSRRNFSMEEPIAYVASREGTDVSIEAGSKQLSADSVGGVVSLQKNGSVSSTEQLPFVFRNKTPKPTDTISPTGVKQRHVDPSQFIATPQPILSISEPIHVPLFDEWTFPEMIKRLRFIAYFNSCIALFPYHEEYAHELMEQIKEIGEHCAIPIAFHPPTSITSDQQEQNECDKAKASTTSRKTGGTTSKRHLHLKQISASQFTLIVYFIGDQADVGSCGYIALKWQTNAGIIKPPRNWVTAMESIEQKKKAVLAKKKENGGENVDGDSDSWCILNDAAHLLEDSAANSEQLSISRENSSFNVFRENTISQGQFEEENSFLFPVTDTQSEEYKEVVARFSKDGFNKEVVKVERVQNFYLYEKYVTHRRQIAKEAGGDPHEERWLIHGTRKTEPSIIIEGGFDLRYSDSGFYGRASYFAYKSSYAHTYRHTVGNGQSQVFLALVACGLIEELKQRKNSIRHPTPPFHSIRGPVSTNCDAIMIYELHQAYPAYLITYKD